MTQLKKGAFLTDIHFGKKSNSPIHNQDCLNHLRWFCEQVRADPTIDYVGFLGDWNENRSAINLATLTYSYTGAKMLNDLGLPVYFVVGNHDLYHRHTREIYSVLPFQEFSNFRVIDTPTIIPEIGDGAFFSPYLFHEEYDKLDEYLSLPFWAGHFEFQGFRVTGYSMVMQHGPDHKKFAGPEHILSGHFHQRQQKDNIVYIGNTFPMDFGDVGDYSRGMAVYDHTIRDVTFQDWPDAPLYLRFKVSKILDGGIIIRPQSRVKCVLDEELSLEETNNLRELMMKQFELREFTYEEPKDAVEAISGTETDVDVPEASGDTDGTTIDDLIVQMLSDIKSDQIDNALLIQQYRRL
jgi:DNA repair exonuclease SbcCD nuclease subunit